MFLFKKLHNLSQHHGFFFFVFQICDIKNLANFYALKREIFVKFTTQKQKNSKISQLFVINFLN
jgi:hypothetical protein